MSDTFGRADLERLAAIVREVTGNNVQEKNLSMLESRLRARMMRLGLDSIGQYWDFFDANEAEERQALQSLMTTHYTFFFREFVHFEALEDWIERNSARLKERFLASRSPVKVWSAACSRGQEVYSLAMFLEFALAKKHGIEFQILGTDIDQESVRYAENGVYPIKEVSTIPHQYLSGLWKKGTGNVKDFAAAHPQLRSRVRFTQLNLLDLGKLPAAEKFDVIFVRNVFIYFSEQDVRRIALGLKDRLADGGLLASGVSEPLRFDEWKLASIGPSVYEKISQAAGGPPPAGPRAIGTPARPLEHKAAVIPLKTGGQTVGQVSQVVQPATVFQPVRREPYRVLCVDDSSTIQALLKKIFSQDPGCREVVAALNGQEAKEKLENGTFDLITLDIHMPVMGGIEFLEKVYKRQNHPPVVMISSVNRKDVELASRALSLGAFDYVEKPAMNNLQKSGDEILTKARMALRHRHSAAQDAAESFDRLIGQRIVVPDASQCIRWIQASGNRLASLESVIRGQAGEYRSPPTVVVAEASDLPILESAFLNWTERNLQRLRADVLLLKPNHFYLCTADFEPTALNGVRARNFSLQILATPVAELQHFGRFGNLQVLLDESIAEASKPSVQRAGLRLSDITPATSFASLSLEFFANLRKAGAA